MAVCFSWVLALPAFALDINETIQNVRLLAIYPSNIIILNRGLEDDVNIGTHAKLRAAEGYAARALCVKSGMQTSHWRIYRVVEPQLISKDLTYSLIGMDASEAPETIEKWQSTDMSSLKDLKAPPSEDKPTSAKSDLPLELKSDEKRLAPKTTGQQIIERTYDPEKLKRDFQSIKGSVYASPWTIQKGGNTSVESTRFGGSLQNEGKKYILQTGFTRTILRAEESGTGEKVINEGTDANATFTVKELSTDWDGYSDLTYRQARYGRFATPKRQLLIAPLGFTRHFAEGNTLKNFFVSYAPTYDTRVHEGFDVNGKPADLDEKGLRHAFRVFMKFEFTPDFSLTSDLRWRPHQDLSNWKLDASDNLSQEKLTATWRLIGKLFVDYEYQWLDDAQLRRLNGLPRVVTVNSLNVRYDFGM